MSPSPIRCRVPWKIQKRSSEPDRWLDEMGFFRKHMARDSSCLFRAVSENIFNTQRYFHNVRLACVQYMSSQRQLFEGSLNCPLENYLKEMSNLSEWGGLIEISAMSHLYRRDFVIFEASKGPQTKICNGYGDIIYLFYSPDTKHFDAVYTKEFINASSFCQSLVYEILYDGVYQIKELPYAVDKMLHDKSISNHIEYFVSENVERRKKQKERAKIFIEAPCEEDKDKNNNALALKCKHYTEDIEKASLLKESLSIFVFNRSLIQLENVCMKCLNVNSAKDLLDNGITPFPYKVAKALDPDIYRNIEFDVWSELRRELRYGARYSDGTTLQVGVKCLCKLQQEQTMPYHCHIQEMRPDGGPCLVFIEELGEKRIVNYDQLEPLPVEEIRPWAPPYRYSRTNPQFLNLSQMLQQIGNISRKQGLAKSRKPKSDEQKNHEMDQNKMKEWKADNYEDMYNNAYSYQQMDFLNYEPMPVEVKALPLMVDMRPAAASASEQPGVPSVPEGHHNQGVAGGDLGAHSLPPASVRATTPATTNAITYTGSMSLAPMSGGMPPGIGGAVVPAGVMGPAGVVGPGGVMGQAGAGAPYGCGAYACGKSLVWMSPHAPPPPPPGVNPHVFKSLQANGADLPMNDIATLRFYFNVGVDCVWTSYGPPPQRHYAPRDLAHEMQQMSLHERPGPAEPRPRPPDRPAAAQARAGAGAQRPLLGPRFKRGGNNQDGGQNNHNNHNQNKGHNNNMPNKGPNNRYPSAKDGQMQPTWRNTNSGMSRNGQEIRALPGAPGVPGPAYPGEECVMEPPVLSMPYMPYPPPVYPIPYYAMENDPAMLGLVPGLGYAGYDEAGEYGQPYYPPPYPPHDHK